MNVYEINGYVIAAKSADEAFGCYMEETNSMDDTYIAQMDQGESDTVEINIRRLTDEQVKSESIYCCDDGPCDFCKDSDEGMVISYQDWMDKHLNDRGYAQVVAR